MPNESSAIRPINTILSWPLPKRSASTPNPPSTPLSRSSRKWRPPNFGTRRAITIDFTSGIIILDVQFSVPGRSMGVFLPYFLAPLLPNGGRCMSKKQSLLTPLALITLIVNLEVRANSLIVAQPPSQRPQNEPALQAAIQQFEAKQYAEAKAALEQLVGREPKNATAAFYLGRIAFELNNADEAVKWFEMAVGLDDKRAVHHHWLAQAYGKKARTGGMMSRASFAGKARDALLKSLELDPGAQDARADLARYYNSVPGIVGGSAERAMEQVEFIKQKDALKGWLLAGELLADKKKFAEAERALLEADKRQSDQFEATYKLGDVYQRAKEFDKAFAAFDRVLQAKPDDLRATYQIGRTAGMSGKNLDRGLTAFEAVKDRLPKDNHEALVGLRWWRGKIYEAKGEREKA